MQIGSESKVVQNITFLFQEHKNERMLYKETPCTRAVHKETELIFFLICCFTHNLLKLVSFKVLPSTLDTPLPTFFPLLERVLELVLRDGAKAPCPIFFYLFYRLKSATFQWGFQLWEQEKVRRGQIWRVGRLGNNSRFMLRQKFTDKEWRVSWCIVIVQRPGVCPRLRPLPSHCHPQTLQNV